MHLHLLDHDAGMHPVDAVSLTPSGLERLSAWLARVAPELPVQPVLSDLLDALVPLAQAGAPLRYRLPAGGPGEGAEIELSAADVELIVEQ